MCYNFLKINFMIKKIFGKRVVDEKKLPASLNSTKNRIVKIDTPKDEEGGEDDDASFLDGWNLFDENPLKKPAFNAEDDDIEDTPKEADKERKEDIIDNSHSFFSSDRFAFGNVDLKKQKEKEDEEIAQSMVFSANVSEAGENINLTTGPRFKKMKNKGGVVR